MWPLFAALPWLLPVHALPWTTFYSEWLMALLWLPMCLWFLLRSSQPVLLDVTVAVCAAVAVVPIAQAAAGLFLFPGEAVFVALLILAFSVTMLVSRHAEATHPAQLADALFTGLLIAASLSALMTAYQWLRLSGLGLLVAELPYGGRPVANVGQANNLSTLLAWGLVALWWRFAFGRLHGALTALLAGLFLCAIALTQSRTGWLAVGFLGLVAIAGHRTLKSASHVKVYLGLALWFVLAVFAVEPMSLWLNEALHPGLSHAGSLSLTQQAAIGKRPIIWAMVMQAIAERPLFGYGWNQSVQAFIAHAANYPTMQVGVQYAHNLVLDLLLWNGLPLGLLLTSGFGAWLWWQGRAALGAVQPAQLLLLAALGVFLLHAMLELPHAYLFFLLPVATIMGTLNALRDADSVRVPKRIALSRWWVALPLVPAALLMGAMFDEYGRIAASVLADRMRAANVVIKAPLPEPKVTLLNFLQMPLQQLRAQPRSDMRDEDLAVWRATLMRYPASGALVRYALGSAWSKRPQEARWALTTLCAIHRQDICEAALREWSETAANGHPEMNEVVVPTLAAQLATPAAIALSAPAAAASSVAR
jgi:O-antigen ligase